MGTTPADLLTLIEHDLRRTTLRDYKDYGWAKRLRSLTSVLCIFPTLAFHFDRKKKDKRQRIVAAGDENQSQDRAAGDDQQLEWDGSMHAETALSSSARVVHMRQSTPPPPCTLMGLRVSQISSAIYVCVPHSSSVASYYMHLLARKMRTSIKFLKFLGYTIWRVLWVRWT